MSRCYLFILLVFLASSAWADNYQSKPQTLTFEKVIDGTSFVASGAKIVLWGIKALPPDNRYAWAAKLYLQSTLSQGVLVCRALGKMEEQPVIHCTINNSDVASLLVQMGMAKATGSYYHGEEAVARSHLRGVWKSTGNAL